MGLKDRLTTSSGASSRALHAALRPGEQLKGAFLATRGSGLKQTTLAVGVTADRLILAPVTGGGDAMSLDAGDIVSSASENLGSTWRKLAGSDVASVTIHSATHGEIKLKLLGDDLAGMALQGGRSSGVLAVQELLARSTGSP